MNSIYDLGPLRLDAGTKVLTRGGAPLALGPRAIAVLKVLVDHHPDYVPKAAILDAAWPGAAVEESNLAVQISTIRKALAQVPGGEHWVETLPWRGYRFAGPVARAPAAGSEAARARLERGNLVPATTSFIGRERERAEILRHLEQVRVLTIVGAGGIGKTRLALETAADLRPRYPDGTWLVELASITDPRFVMAAVARVLGVREQAGQPLSHAICHHLQVRRALLVLDNCEQVRAPVAELVAAIREQAPHVTIVATSREPLAMAGEHTHPLEPLSLPARDADGESIEQAEAVRLFMARARQQQPDFALTGGRASTVAQLCIDLDGIPLALELAAARMHSLSVEQIGARLGDRFRLLTSNAWPAAPRQQTLRAAMDWSYDLLAEDERTVLRRMAVFVDGCTIEAVAAVTADPTLDEHAAIDVLTRLARRSLVTVAVGGGGLRYRLLQTTRAYALEKLDEAGETAATRRRHAEHYRRLFTDVYETSFRMSDTAWREHYTPELENVRAALGWAFGEGDAAVGIGLTAPAAHLLQANLAERGEARGWIETALARADERTSDLDRAQLWLASALHAEVSSLTKVNDTYAHAIDLLRRAGDRAGLAHALVCGAYPLVYAHRLDEADAALAEAGPLLEGTQRTRSLINYFGALSSLKSARDDVEGSLAACESAIGLCRGIGANRTAAMLLSNLGDASWLAGDLDRAHASLCEAVALMRSLPAMESSSAMCICLLNLVGVLVERGAHDEALDVARETLPLAADNRLTPLLVDHLALRAALMGRHDDAARLAGFNDARHAALGMVRQRSELRARDRLRALLHEAFPAADVERLAAAGAAIGESEAVALAMRA